MRYLGHDVAEEDRAGDEHEGAQNLGYASVAQLTGTLVVVVVVVVTMVVVLSFLASIVCG
jgi:hypothetical protein